MPANLVLEIAKKWRPQFQCYTYMQPNAYIHAMKANKYFLKLNYCGCRPRVGCFHGRHEALCPILHRKKRTEKKPTGKNYTFTSKTMWETKFGPEIRLSINFQQSPCFSLQGSQITGVHYLASCSQPKHKLYVFSDLGWQWRVTSAANQKTNSCVLFRTCPLNFPRALNTNVLLSIKPLFDFILKKWFWQGRESLKFSRNTLWAALKLH